jgi:hypothetical protein
VVVVVVAVIFAVVIVFVFSFSHFFFSFFLQLTQYEADKKRVLDALGEAHAVQVSVIRVRPVLHIFFKLVSIG